VVIAEVLSSSRWTDSYQSLEWLVQLLRDEGVDLLVADPAALDRGTPVYVQAGADVIDVQRLMAQNHIRMLPVVRDEEVIGIVDLLDLALREDLGGDSVIEEATRPSP